MQYPKLYRLIDEMGVCNNMPRCEDPEWPTDVDLVALEEQASRIPEDDIETFVDGEEFDMEELVEEHDVMDLFRFLTEVFDGKYSENFYDFSRWRS